MKLKERGLGTGAIVGIVVAIVAIAIVVPVTLIVLGGGGCGGVAGLSKYPGATDAGMTLQQAFESGGYSMPSGWSGNVYTTQDSTSSVISWYRGQITGWTTVADNTISYGDYSVNILAYTKGTDALFVEAISVSGQTIIVVASGPESGLSGLAPG